MIGMSQLADALGWTDRRSWPNIGAVGPGIAPRLVLAASGSFLSFTAYRSAFPIVVGVLLAVVAAAVPRTMAAWILILFLGASRIPRDHSALDWRLLVLIFGLHLIHVVGAQALKLPVRSWVQVAMFRAPLLRFIAIQVPVQLVAIATLLLFGSRSDGGQRVEVAALGTVGAVAFVAVTLLLAAPLRRQKTR
jgi:hypothetical protein